MSTLTDLLSGSQSLGLSLATGGGAAGVAKKALEWLAVPGNYARGALAGQPGTPMVGREMLEAQGILGSNTSGLDWGDVAGFAADVAVDPLNLIPVGALAKWASRGSKAGLAEKIAAPAAARVIPELSVAAGLERPASFAITGDGVTLGANNPLPTLKPWAIGDPASWTPQPVIDTLSESVWAGGGKHFTDELPIPNGPRFVRDPIEEGGAAYDIWQGDKQIGLVEVHDDYNLDQGSKRLFKDIVKPDEKVVRLQNIGLEEGSGDAFRKTGVGREMWRKAFGEAGDNWLGNSQLGFQGGDTTAVDSLQKLADRGFVELHWGRYGPGSNFVAKLTPKGKQWVAGEVDVPRLTTVLKDASAAEDTMPGVAQQGAYIDPADILSQFKLGGQWGAQRVLDTGGLSEASGKQWFRNKDYSRQAAQAIIDGDKMWVPRSRRIVSEFSDTPGAFAQARIGDPNEMASMVRGQSPADFSDGFSQLTRRLEQPETQRAFLERQLGIPRDMPARQALLEATGPIQGTAAHETTHHATSGWRNIPRERIADVHNLQVESRLRGQVEDLRGLPKEEMAAEAIGSGMGLKKQLGMAIGETVPQNSNLQRLFGDASQYDSLRKHGFDDEAIRKLLNMLYVAPAAAIPAAAAAYGGNLSQQY